MSDTAFAADFRALLARHGITHPRFAYGQDAFNPKKPSVLYSGPVYGEDEIVAATVALVEGKWSVAGEYTHRFEQAFSRYLGQKESVMVNSGSSADLLMIAAAKRLYGWRDGDGVIVSPTNFPTTVSAITLNGLVPVFVDIEWETLNTDNDTIERTLAVYARGPGAGVELNLRYVPETVRAILVSPVLGNPPDMDRLTAMADRYGVKLLFDGCDSLGSTWRGKHLAQYATASTCSFYSSHHISLLNGGAISSNDEGLIQTARQMATWGRGCRCTAASNLLPNGVCGKRFDCWLEACPDIVVDHRYTYGTDKAYNLQQVDILSAMGLVQLAKIEEIHAGRRAAFCRIERIIATYLGDVRLATQHDQADPSWFGVPLICPDYAYKRALVAHLEAAGIQTRNYFAGSVLQHQGYAHLGRAADYPNANEVLKRVFFIGCAPFYTDEHFNHIEKTVKAFKQP